ncbi:HAMP domain-containing histidine kinase [Akkermansiaceae bacterium]|nr:HAMP domain-containing histidine kinase [Akkermansiaceae bacterium]
MSKSRKAQSSLAGWAVAVTLPLVVLAAVAALGIRAQKQAARTRAMDEAAVVSASQADPLSRQLQAAIEEFPRFPDPPVPGSGSSLEEDLDGSDLGKLSRLRDNPEAGKSATGLPLRALAALRIEALAPGEQAPDEIARLLTVEAPSVLTLPALKRLQDRHPGFEIPEVWRLVDKLDEVRAGHPDGGWISFEQRYWWISPDARRFLRPSAIGTASLELPAHATARLSSNGKPLTPPASGEVLASTPVDFPSPLALGGSLSSPDALAANTRQQTRWTLAIVGTSLLVSAIGLFAILRMVREERRLSHLKGQFVSSVSHELRAPLGSIRLMAEALEDGRVDEPGEFHRLIGQESRRLSHLVENVLDFARIEEGRRRYDFVETDLAALVGETAELFGPRAAESAHTLDVFVEPGTASVDRHAVQQAVANLLDNALKFSPPSTTVSVVLRWSESAWSISIIDEGPGIPESERERIFERFHRLGDELRRETKGTGIGLSLVRHITEAHGGTASVTNGPTTFTLSTPIHPPVSP